MPTLLWLAIILGMVLLSAACRTERHHLDGVPDWHTLMRGARPVRRWRQRLDPTWRSRRR